jgi:hypothetical protein
MTRPQPRYVDRRYRAASRYGPLRSLHWRGHNQQLVALAANIARAQSPEMTQIAALQASFRKPAPTTYTATMADMPRIMTPDQRNMPKDLSGKDFGRMLLQMLIDYHTGAITISNTELSAGANPGAKSLAQQIIATSNQKSIRCAPCSPSSNARRGRRPGPARAAGSISVQSNTVWSH